MADMRGKVVVITFVLFVIAGVTISVLLARKMRPATMADRGMGGGH